MSFDLHLELLLIHSPLLQESSSVSHPLLTYMLKFSRWVHPTSCSQEALHTVWIMPLLKCQSYLQFKIKCSAFMAAQHYALHQWSVSQMQGANVKIYSTSEMKHWQRHPFRKNLKAYASFNILLALGILQVTMLITFHNVLHQHLNQGIHSWKSNRIFYITITNTLNISMPDNPSHAEQHFIKLSLPFTLHTQAVLFTHVCVTYWVSPDVFDTCKWSFRRFTYGNLVTTSPSSKW